MMTGAMESIKEFWVKVEECMVKVLPDRTTRNWDCKDGNRRSDKIFYKLKYFSC